MQLHYSRQRPAFGMSNKAGIRMQTMSSTEHLCMQTRSWAQPGRRSVYTDVNLAGERDFRDFFCLPPAKENR